MHSLGQVGVAIALVVVALGAMPVAQDVEHAPPDADARALKQLGRLDWLAGTWRGTFEGGEWEVSYTTPYAGEIISANKEIKTGRVRMIEFERFRVRDGAVTMTPYPFGRESPVSFTLREMETNDDAQRAIFTNPDHDFPQRIVYERRGEDRLIISITGEQRGTSVTLNLNLKRLDP